MSIEAMKLWLKALETSWYHVGTFCPTDAAIELYDEARNSLRQAIEQAQKQEPVAWGMMNDDGVIYDCICPEEHDRHQGEYTTPLYTSPPQRQPLTDEQIDELWESTASYYNTHDFARAIEAAHGIKEKNHG